MPNISIAMTIVAFLNLRARPWLASLYHPGMEVQVNVARDGGTRVGGYDGHKRLTYTDAAQTWYPIRIPKNAWGDPEDNSGNEMLWDLEEHADGVGMTGWCFSDRRSLWVAFDFDSIIGHSERHTRKMTDAELAEVKTRACSIPWVKVLKSSSGSGLHLYVHFASPPVTANHDEHAALGRAILSEMSAAAGFDFHAKVDACGGNMWVWARKMEGTDGLTVVKEPECNYEGEPKGWRQHVDVVRGKRKKALPEFMPEGLEPSYDETCGTAPHVPLDVEHRKLLDCLKKIHGYGWWDNDRRILVCHTEALKRAHGELGMRGPFETITDASEPDVQNCFAHPGKDGSWCVRRFTPGVQEAPTWDQDGRGWTKCWLNRDADLRTASRTHGGVETASGNYAFKTFDEAREVVKLLGGHLKELKQGRKPAQLAPHKDGRRVIVEVKKDEYDNASDMVGWYEEKGKWRTVVQVVNQLEQSTDVGIHDETIRHAVTEGRVDAGWFIRVDTWWHHEPNINVKLALSSFGKAKTQVDQLMGSSIRKPWIIVSRPFQDEYPGDRNWNRVRAKFKYPRSEEVGAWPHWEKVLKHCGAGLDEALAKDAWALANDIKTGAEYLKLWLAAVLQFPYEPTPFLFFWGPQDCGKSIFHEMLPLLIDGGVVLANSIFEKDERFNGALEGAVFCVIEEMNLQKNKKAYERIKTWVTSPRLTLRKLYFDAFDTDNYTHWMHMSNDHDAVGFFPGDSRITAIHVNALDPGKMIPKEELIGLLRREAPHFLNHILGLEIPPSGSRLKVPIVETSEKIALSQQNETPLEEFIELNCHYVPGKAILLSEFWDKFQSMLEPEDRGVWTKHSIKKNMPPEKFPVGKIKADTYIGNISWTPATSSDAGKRKLQLEGRKLV